MRTLLRNKQRFWFANITGTTRTVDEYGYETGESEVAYSEPVEFEANISAARGTTDLDAFGINTNYTKTIVTDDLTVPIDKSTILWIDCAPERPETSSMIML